MASSRARRQRRETHIFVDERGAQVVTSTGVKVEIAGAALDRITDGSQLDNIPAGQHLWASILVFRVVHPEKWVTEQQHMDSENLIMVAPPGCYVCEQIYSPAVAALLCPGEPA